MPTLPPGSMRIASELLVLMTRGRRSLVPRKLASVVPALPVRSHGGIASPSAIVPPPLTSRIPRRREQSKSPAPPVCTSSRLARLPHLRGFSRRCQLLVEFAVANSSDQGIDQRRKL